MLYSKCLQSQCPVGDTRSCCQLNVMALLTPLLQQSLSAYVAEPGETLRAGSVEAEHPGSLFPNKTSPSGWPEEHSPYWWLFWSERKRWTVSPPSF